LTSVGSGHAACPLSAVPVRLELPCRPPVFAPTVPGAGGLRDSSRVRPEPSPRCCCLSCGLRQAERPPNVSHLAGEGRPNCDGCRVEPVLVAVTWADQPSVVRPEDAGQRDELPSEGVMRLRAR